MSDVTHEAKAAANGEAARPNSRGVAADERAPAGGTTFFGGAVEVIGGHGLDVYRDWSLIAI